LGERRNREDMTKVIGGNVLVMDDEEAILEIVGDILAYHGFTVDFAGTARKRSASTRKDGTTR
jgi:DNA-binding response OmpR family regulator